jgi:exodeoxyribonuclease V gamma subunit
MLILHESNRFEALCAALVARLRAEPAGVFEPAWVVVPGPAMRHALTLRIADELGICANVRMPLLAPFLWEQVGRVVPGVCGPSPLDPPLLAWRILEALADTAAWEAHPRLAAHLHAADERARLTLATQLASLFDDYLAYRPDWLEAWEQGRAVPGLGAPGSVQAADARWQAALWRRLQEEEAGAASLRAVEAFCREAPAATPETRAAWGLPRTVHVFAPGALAPRPLQLLWALSEAAEVHTYLLNPCRAHWFDLVDPRRLAELEARGQADHHEVGHPLLTRWGRQAQATLGLLHELAGGEGVAGEEAFEETGGHSLLARLQDSLLDLSPPERGQWPLAEGDRSIEVHVCHSLTRELEVLHDRLLGLYAEPPGGQPLQPWEVLVVTPDLEAAAPLVEAVFGTAPAERQIPYTLTGRARSRSQAAARALLALLDLAASRWRASEVFGLLQQPLVARRFHLDASSLDRLHAWLRDGGARWGVDAAHRQSLGLPEVPTHTVGDALERLFLGLALPSPAREVVQGLLPAGDAEGSEALALGSLDAYVQRLSALRTQLAGHHGPERWAQVLAAAVEDFLEPAPEDADELLELRAALDTLAERWRLSGLSQPLGLETVRPALAAVLDEPRRGSRPGGSVTFAPMAALRHLPHRVVAAIGLNDGAFPGTDRPAEFDLLAQAPRHGDRQRRLDDRNVFLDLLLACRDVLHLSYTGRSVRDNSPLPPSPLVSELLETLRHAVPAGDRLVIAHPLQPFSPRLFASGGDPRLHSFHAEYAAALQQRAQPALPADLPPRAAQGEPEPAAEAEDDDTPPDATAPAFFVRPLPPPDASWHTVSLEQLVAFFLHPSRYLLERRLGLHLPRGPQALEDDEPFVESSATRRTLAGRLLPVLLADPPPDADAALALARAGVELPGGAVGEAWLAREWAALQSFSATLRAHAAPGVLAPHASRLDIDLDGEPWRLQATFSSPRPDGLLGWRYDELRVEDHLRAWITHLAWLAGGVPAASAPRSLWCGRHGAIAFEAVEQPGEHLRELLRLYRRGLAEPLPFFARSAWALVCGKGLREARQTWTGRTGAAAVAGERDDAAHALAWRGRPDPLTDGLAAFEATAHAVLDPLRDHLHPA